MLLFELVVVEVEAGKTISWLLFTLLAIFNKPFDEDDDDDDDDGLGRIALCFKLIWLDSKLEDCGDVDWVEDKLGNGDVKLGVIATLLLEFDLVVNINGVVVAGVVVPTNKSILFDDVLWFLFVCLLVLVVVVVVFGFCFVFLVELVLVVLVVAWGFGWIVTIFDDGKINEGDKELDEATTLVGAVADVITGNKWPFADKINAVCWLVDVLLLLLIAEFVGDIPKQIAELQTRIKWRKARRSAPKCLYCGSINLASIPDEEEFRHPATGQRMKVSGRGFTDAAPWHATYTSEGDLIKSAAT